MKIKIFNVSLFSICSMLAGIMLLNCANKKNDILVGDWSPTVVEIHGTKMKYSDLGINNSLFDLYFTKDGRCSVTIGGIETDGIYFLNRTAVDIELNDKNEKLWFQSGTLTMSLDYGNSDTLITFVRTK